MPGLATRHLRDHCLAPERIDAPLDGAGRYGRVFDLPALAVDEPLRRRIGAAGGFCDGGDGEQDSNVEAGWPFFGRYVAHDLTADRSPLRAARGPAGAAQHAHAARQPRVALRRRPARIAVHVRARGPGEAARGDGDRPRNAQGLALIGDPRDPESYLALEPEWEPTLPRHAERFALRDILVAP